MNKIKISIIVCTRNRFDSLSQTLLTILKAVKFYGSSRKDVEIIVVDNASSDNTKQTVSRFKKSNPSLILRYVIEPSVGVSYARNTGIKAARGNVISFIDDDTHLSVNWLQSAISAIRSNPFSKIIFGRVTISKYLATNKIVEDLANLNALWSLGVVDLGSFSHSISKDLPVLINNSLIQKNVFEKIGFFDTNFGSAKNGYQVYGGEDIDFIERVNKANLPMFYDAMLIVRHVILEHKLSWSYVKWRHYANGIERALFWSKHAELPFNKNSTKINILWMNACTFLLWPLKYLPIFSVYYYKCEIRKAFLRGYYCQIFRQ